MSMRIDPTTRGRVGLVVQQRFEGEDVVLAQIRDVHERIVALRDTPEFASWLLRSHDEAEAQGKTDPTIDDLRAAELLFYVLRGGRAIETEGGGPGSPQ